MFKIFLIIANSIILTVMLGLMMANPGISVYCFIAGINIAGIILNAINAIKS